MDNPFVKRLLWSGLLAGLGSLATIPAMRSYALRIAGRWVWPKVLAARVTSTMMTFIRSRSWR